MKERRHHSVSALGTALAASFLIGGCATEPVPPAVTPAAPPPRPVVVAAPPPAPKPVLTLQRVPGVSYAVAAEPYRIHIIAADNGARERLADSRMPAQVTVLRVGVTNISDGPVPGPRFSMIDSLGREHVPSAKSHLVNRDHFLWEPINPGDDRLIALIFELPFQPSRRTLEIFFEHEHVGSIPVEIVERAE